MPRWSIGPIVGRYQPEDFSESQRTNYEDVKAFGIVHPIIFKNWSPREVRLSFVVNAMGITAADLINNPAIPKAPHQSDPEVVWAMICAMQRPGDRGLPATLGGRESSKRNFPRVVIPGWGVTDFSTPTRAVVVDASIKRTHIGGTPPRCVRGIISVTLRELARQGGIGSDRNLRAFSDVEAGTKKVKGTDAGITTVFRGFV